MRRNSLSVKLVLAALLLGLVAWGLYSSIEFYEETEESGWSVDALRNPYLAAQQFMYFLHRVLQCLLIASHAIQKLW